MIPEADRQSENLSRWIYTSTSSRKELVSEQMNFSLILGHVKKSKANQLQKSATEYAGAPTSVFMQLTSTSGNG